MKKILVFTNSVSGLYGFRKELLAELTKNHDLTVYSPLEGTFAIEKLEQMGCRLVNVKMERYIMNIHFRKTFFTKVDCRTAT